MEPNQTDMFCTAKETIKKKKNPKRQPMEWEKIVSNDPTNLISKIYTQFIQLNRKKKKHNKQNQ